MTKIEQSNRKQNPKYMEKWILLYSITCNMSNPDIFSMVRLFILSITL